MPEESGLAQAAVAPEPRALGDESVQQHHPAERRPGHARRRGADLLGRTLDAHAREHVGRLPQHRFEFRDHGRERADRITEQAVDREHEQARREGQGLEGKTEAPALFERKGREQRRQQHDDGGRERGRRPEQGRKSPDEREPGARRRRPGDPGSAREQAEDDQGAGQPRRHRQREEREQRGEAGRQEGPERIRSQRLQQRRHRFAAGSGLAPTGLSAGRCKAGARGSAPA